MSQHSSHNCKDFLSKTQMLPALPYFYRQKSPPTTPPAAQHHPLSEAPSNIPVLHRLPQALWQGSSWPTEASSPPHLWLLGPGPEASLQRWTCNTSKKQARGLPQSCWPDSVSRSTVPSLGVVSLGALMSLPLEATKEQGHEKKSLKISALDDCKLFFFFLFFLRDFPSNAFIKHYSH